MQCCMYVHDTHDSAGMDRSFGGLLENASLLCCTVVAENTHEIQDRTVYSNLWALRILVWNRLMCLDLSWQEHEHTAAQGRAHTCLW